MLVEFFFFGLILPFANSNNEFPTKRDSPTFRNKGTEVPSLSWDKGTTEQAQNLAKGQDGPENPVKNTGRDGTRF